VKLSNLEECFNSWIAALWPNRHEFIAIDGKLLLCGPAVWKPAPNEGDDADLRLLSADNTAKKQRGRPFDPGQSGNP
jgi:hypothetical protein